MTKLGSWESYQFPAIQRPRPNLTENALRNALPPEVEVLTIQDERETYVESSRFRHESPSLALPDESWATVVEAMIPFADLIVSEPLMLGQGVRRELEMLFACRNITMEAFATALRGISTGYVTNAVLDSTGLIAELEAIAEADENCAIDVIIINS